MGRTFVDPFEGGTYDASRCSVAHNEFPLDPQQAPLLRARNVQKTLGSGDTTNPVLRGVSLDIASREYVSIVGASGSGESTLLHLLRGLAPPTQNDPVGE